MDDDELITVLVVGSPGWPADEAVRQLQEAGHETVRCHEHDDRLPCRRLVGSGGCPLDDEVDVALVLRDHPHPKLRPNEVGAVCALREDVPLVVMGRTLLHPFEEVDPVVLTRDDDVVVACVDVAERRPTTTA